MYVCIVYTCCVCVFVFNVVFKSLRGRRSIPALFVYGVLKALELHRSVDTGFERWGLFMHGDNDLIVVIIRISENHE